MYGVEKIMVRILIKKEAKKIDVDYIYKNGNHIAIVSQKFKEQWEKDEWKKEKKEIH